MIGDQELPRQKRCAFSTYDHPQLKAIVGFCSPAVPGAAEAVKQARRDLHTTSWGRGRKGPGPAGP